MRYYKSTYIKSIECICHNPYYWLCYLEIWRDNPPLLYIDFFFISWWPKLIILEVINMELICVFIYVRSKGYSLCYLCFILLVVDNWNNNVVAVTVKYFMRDVPSCMQQQIFAGLRYTC